VGFAVILAKERTTTTINRASTFRCGHSPILPCRVLLLFRRLDVVADFLHCAAGTEELLDGQQIVFPGPNVQVVRDVELVLLG